MAITLQGVLLFLMVLASAKALGHSYSSIIGLSKRRFLSTGNINDFELRTYSQTLDHFNYGAESYITFQQRYAINFKYWGGVATNSPIFLHMGAERTFDDDLGPKFLVDHAPHFKALLVYVEHRYYGESYPFGSREEAYRNSNTLQYLSSTQSLADHAQIIRDLKSNLSAENSPVIAVGGSYGGMLAAWFRLKYPHMVIGALASSAPILYFDDITPQNGYFSVVSNDFKETSESCYETIKSSWSEIDKFAAVQNGLAILSQMFNTCSPLSNIGELKNALELLYSSSAQYDDPKRSPVSKMCSGIDGEPHGTSVLQRIISGIKAINGDSACFHLLGTSGPAPPLPGTEDDSQNGWDWQVCTEMVMPIGSSGPDTMFWQFPFDFENFSQNCEKQFNVTPRPHWITTEYGGHNIKNVLERFGSNIIFSNGLRDPYSTGGVLQNISNSIVALVTAKGSHCLDTLGSDVTDPDWLVSQRNAEVQIMENWIEEYNAKNK